LKNTRACSATSGVRSALDLNAATSPLSPRKLLAACAALQPAVLDTVPWLVEGALTLVERGEADGGVLGRLEMIIAGGAPLNGALLAPLLRQHGITLWPHYGMTELGGPAMMGGLVGSLGAMRPLGTEVGVQVELVNAEGVTSEEAGSMLTECSMPANSAHLCFRLVMPGKGLAAVSPLKAAALMSEASTYRRASSSSWATAPPRTPTFQARADAASRAKLKCPLTAAFTRGMSFGACCCRKARTQGHGSNTFAAATTCFCTRPAR